MDIGHFVFLSPPWGLGTTYVVHLRLIGKHAVYFLLVSIELFSLGVMAELVRAKEIENRQFRFNAVSLIQNFR